METPPTTYILLIENPSPLEGSLYHLLIRQLRVLLFQTGSDALRYLQGQSICPALIIYNARTMRNSGNKIIGQIKRLCPNVPLLMVTAQPQNSSNNADFVITPPLTPRKIFAKIRPFLPQTPAPPFCEGGIAFSPDRRLLIRNGKAVLLTPLLTRLLNELITARGKAIERHELFRRVWNTTYTQDTRTLDVHITWLRRYIEEDPKKPKVIQTVRGFGYRYNAPSRDQPPD